MVNHPDDSLDDPFERRIVVARVRGGALNSAAECGDR
jgi:hypothetical protein